ncbi:MAG: protein translocase subunit SecF [Deltaproteobacteria bacterium]|nr:protein translocase subunit SecF [Deltaproteobacteria bacterium]
MSGKKLPEFPFTSFVKPGTLIRFSRAAKICGAFSMLLFVFAGWQYFSGQFRYGIDFAGGLDLQVRFEPGVNTAAVRKKLSEAGLTDVLIQGLTAEGQKTGEVVSAGSIATAEKQAETAAGEETASGSEAEPPVGKAAATAAAEPAKDGTEISEEAGKATAVLPEAADEPLNLTGPEYLIKVKMEGEDISERAAAVRAALTKGFGERGYEILRQEGAGPAAVKDLSRKAIESVVYAMLFLFIYILIRFSQLDFASAVGFGTGAVFATFHDVVMVMAMFVLFGYEFSLPVLAAFLTVVGYSVNDTIVVFDRIRERLSRHRTADLWDLFDQCASDTLSRTIITGGTTAVSAAALLIFGGGVIHDFAFIMLWGVIFGTYSSIFVASPVFILVTRYLQSRQSRRDSTRKKPRAQRA